MPNQDQVLSLVRSILAIVGTMLATKGVVSSSDWTTYSGAILVFVPIVWSMFAHTDSAKLKAVEAMPDVKNIVVVNGKLETPTPAASAAVAAAADPSRPKVVNTADYK